MKTATKTSLLTLASLTTLGLLGCDVPPAGDLDDGVEQRSHALHLLGVSSPSTTDSSAGAALQFVVSRTLEPTTEALTVKFSTLSGTDFGFANGATSGTSCSPGVDFIGVTNRDVVFPVGAESVTVPVTVCQDALIEGTQTVIGKVGDCGGEGLCFGIGSITDGTLQPPVLTIDDAAAREPVKSVPSAAVFNVRLSRAIAEDVTVHYATSNGTAFAGFLSPFCTGDYLPKSGVVTIPANGLVATITVPVCGDALVEPIETFFVTLSSPSANATLGSPARGTGRISGQ
jgi:hypothetical protein